MREKLVQQCSIYAPFAYLLIRLIIHQHRRVTMLIRYIYFSYTWLGADLWKTENFNCKIIKYAISCNFRFSDNQ